MANDYDIETGSRIIDDSTEAFIEKVASMEGVYVEEIIKQIERLHTKREGGISNDKHNRRIVNTLLRAVNRAGKKAGYNKLVSEFLTNFNRLRDWQYWFHSTQNGLDIQKPLLTEAKNIVAQQTINRLTGQGLRAEFVQPLRNELRKAINQGGSLVDLIRTLEAQLESNDERQGAWRRYVTQVARDSLGQADGYAQEVVRTTFDLNAIRYVGSLVRDSRPQCRRWVRKDTILYTELDEEIRWAYRNGSGMIRPTTPSNFLENRGGYNCRHTAIPVRE